jgi:hypothetical protein
LNEQDTAHHGLVCGLVPGALGMFASCLRASAHARCTTQDSERSWRMASAWIYRSTSSGKYSDCFVLLFTVVLRWKGM